MNLVSIIPDPDFKPDAGTKLQFQAVKEKGEISGLPYPTAMENIKNSGGMYKIKREANEDPPQRLLSLEDMSNEELKLWLLKVGVEPAKQMKRAEVIKSIQLKLDQVSIVADE